MNEEEKKPVASDVDPRIHGILSDNTYKDMSKLLQGVGLTFGGIGISSSSSLFPENYRKIASVIGAGGIGAGAVRAASAFQPAEQEGQPGQDEGEDIKDRNLLPVTSTTIGSEYSAILQELASPLTPSPVIGFTVANRADTDKKNIFAGFTVIPPTGEIWNLEPEKFSIDAQSTKQVKSNYAGWFGIPIKRRLGIMINQKTDKSFTGSKVISGEFDEYRGTWKIRYSVWNKYPGDKVDGLVRMTDTGYIEFQVE